MLQNISKIGKILKAANRVNFVEFNSTLPVKMKVLKEINPITYKIQLGNREVETKSYVPLEIGKKYLAQIKESKNKLEIKNLREYPKLLDELEKVEIKKELTHYTKDEILKHLQNAKNKDEFMFFANLLLAYQKNIKHLTINQENKKALMQYKFKKNKVTFYAVFSNLAEVSGEIYPNRAIIYSPYENVIALLKNYKDLIDLEVEIYKKEPKPLYEFQQSLLDLKA